MKKNESKKLWFGIASRYKLLALFLFCYTVVKGHSQEQNRISIQARAISVINALDQVSKNKITLIDFWASWCAPCLAEVPHLKEAYKGYRSRGFEIVGISLDQSSEAWKKP